ncbi:hypothetical protein BCR42DRAFT_403931 [Absidia repens]|uniref:Uncharacterized protein n=1 Tax=Absidia repens TaxID=90262 RepID=A0A1X2IVI2_9FUNG|nr:hypothetical protein BCR42DRAFT_403931 [Absidia repens]
MMFLAWDFSVIRVLILMLMLILIVIMAVYFWIAQNFVCFSTPPPFSFPFPTILHIQ